MSIAKIIFILLAFITPTVSINTTSIFKVNTIFILTPVKYPIILPPDNILFMKQKPLSITYVEPPI